MWDSLYRWSQRRDSWGRKAVEFGIKLEHIVYSIIVVDFVYIYVDSVAFPSSKKFDVIVGNTICRSGDCSAFSEGITGEADGRDCCSEEHFLDLVDEILSVE